MYVVNYSLHMLPDAGIAAFDYAWCICLSRIGKRLGYLSKKEAEYYMIQAAKLAQNSYSDWHEYFLAFHIGSHFNKLDIEFISKDKYNIFTHSVCLELKILMCIQLHGKMTSLQI